jgi:uncharacterized protein (DUF3820 family)
MPDEHAHPPPEECPHCGGRDLISKKLSGGMHYAQLECRACGTWLRWLPSPWTRTRAENFVAPIGKHKGRKISELPRDYLFFAANEWSGNPGKACRIVAGLDQPDPTGA